MHVRLAMRNAHGYEVVLCTRTCRGVRLPCRQPIAYPWPVACSLSMCCCQVTRLDADMISAFLRSSDPFGTKVLIQPDFNPLETGLLDNAMNSEQIAAFRGAVVVRTLEHRFQLCTTGLQQGQNNDGIETE